MSVLLSCARCGAAFEDRGRDTHWLGDARGVLCDDCLAVWRAERDRFYAQARERNRAVCAEQGHVVWEPVSPGYCQRCGAVLDPSVFVGDPAALERAERDAELESRLAESDS